MCSTVTRSIEKTVTFSDVSVHRIDNYSDFSWSHCGYCFSFLDGTGGFSCCWCWCCCCGGYFRCLGGGGWKKLGEPLVVLSSLNR